MKSFMYDLNHFSMPVATLFLALFIVGLIVWVITFYTARAVAARLLLVQAAHLKSLVHVLNKDLCELPRTNPELFLISRQDEIDNDKLVVEELRRIRELLDTKSSLLK
jgi:hypothetical protein